MGANGGDKQEQMAADQYANLAAMQGAENAGAYVSDVQYAEEQVAASYVENSLALQGQENAMALVSDPPYTQEVVYVDSAAAANASMADTGAANALALI